MIRAESKRETREALITAGMLEFAEKGIDAASLDAICARAGKTRGAFYVHFADRDELLAAVFERMLGSFYDAVIAPAGGADSLQQTVAGYVAAVAADAPAIRNTGPWKFQHTLAACGRSPALRKRYAALQAQAIARVAAAARAGQQAGTVRADVPAERIGELLVALSLGISAMREIQAPLDVAGGGAALVSMLAPAPPASPARRRRTASPSGGTGRSGRRRRRAPAGGCRSCSPRSGCPARAGGRSRAGTPRRPCW
jgi:TetR/AcrR family transcriptional regulator, transcriptional repressor for nem operon